MCINRPGCDRNSLKLVKKDNNFRYYECIECGRHLKVKIIKK